MIPESHYFFRRLGMEWWPSGNWWGGNGIEASKSAMKLGWNRKVNVPSCIILQNSLDNIVQVRSVRWRKTSSFTRLIILQSILNITQMWRPTHPLLCWILIEFPKISSPVPTIYNDTKHLFSSVLWYACCKRFPRRNWRTNGFDQSVLEWEWPMFAHVVRLIQKSKVTRNHPYSEWGWSEMNFTIPLHSRNTVCTLSLRRTRKTNLSGSLRRKTKEPISQPPSVCISVSSTIYTILLGEIS